MSGLEVIGVVASASQLVRYILEIIDYTQTIWIFTKGASCPFQQHREHLESLISAIRTIRQTPSLQKPVIENHLKALLKITEPLCAALRRYSTDLPRSPVRKFLAALQAGKTEVQILKDLASLERQKSNLSLCISSLHGIALHQIKEKMDSGFVIVPKDTPEDNPTFGWSTSCQCVSSIASGPILNFSSRTAPVPGNPEIDSSIEQQTP